MIKSMTGFASLTRDDELATITVTIKAVNHRFLDLQLRVPSSVASRDADSKPGAGPGSRGRGRGHRFDSAAAIDAVEVELNEPFLDALKVALERARERGYVEGRIGASDLLGFPQALSIREKPDDASDPEPSPLAGAGGGGDAAALDELDSMRIREGGYLKADLDARASGWASSRRSPPPPMKGLPAFKSGCRSAFASCGPRRWPTRRWSRRRSPSSSDARISPRRSCGSAAISTTGGRSAIRRNRAAASSTSCCRR